jgi:hypothetical protein
MQLIAAFLSISGKMIRMRNENKRALPAPEKHAPFILADRTAFS